MASEESPGHAFKAQADELHASESAAPCRVM